MGVIGKRWGKENKKKWFVVKDGREEKIESNKKRAAAKGRGAIKGGWPQRGGMGRCTEKGMASGVRGARSGPRARPSKEKAPLGWTRDSNIPKADQYFVETPRAFFGTIPFWDIFGTIKFIL